MKKRNKKHIGIRYREHTEVEKEYIYLFDKFSKACEVAYYISLNQAGIDTDGRGIRGADIFTRQVLTAHSLKKLLPVLKNGVDPDKTVWDMTTIALVSRSIMENFQSLYYFGTEEISEHEADLRFQIFQKDRNFKWKEIRKKMGQTEDELSEFIHGIPEQRKIICNHVFFVKLSERQQEKILKRNAEIYYSHADFETRCPRLKNLSLHYQLLSNLAHPLPLAIDRIDEIKGHGSANDIDISYVNISLDIASECLIASIEEMAIKFPEHIGSRFGHLIHELDV